MTEAERRAYEQASELRGGLSALLRATDWLEEQSLVVRHHVEAADGPLDKARELRKKMNEATWMLSKAFRLAIVIQREMAK